MEKYLQIVSFFLLASCGLIIGNASKNQLKQSDYISKKIEKIDDEIKLTDKTVKFLWLDSNASIVINEEFCKTISTPEKAVLGFVATFIGNECWWDGEYSNKRDNLKCKILTALELGYQCSDTHLGFLRQWFKKDLKSIKEIEACPTIPKTSTNYNSFDEIVLTTKGNQIIVFYKASGYNMRIKKRWNWSQTEYYQYDNDNIKLVKRYEPQVNVDYNNTIEE